MSNLKQLGLGFAQYNQDYDGRYPGAAQLQKWGNGGHWVAGVNNEALTNGAGDYTGKVATPEKGAIYPYVKSQQIYLCPSVPNNSEKRETYTMNCAIAGASESALSETASVVLLDDEENNNDGFFYAVNNPNSTDQMTDIHNGGGNLLFADGHVKYYPFKAYPLSNDTGALKARTVGAPRFYDLGLGSTGYYDSGATVFGSCAAP